VKRTTCFLCDAPLTPVDDDLQEHPKTETCDVRHTDAWGIAITKEAEGRLKLTEPDEIDIRTFPPIEAELIKIFDNAGVPRLGGASTGRGWSSFSTFQRCPYAWRRKYVQQIRPAVLIESPSLSIGTLVHTFLAVHYTLMMDPSYPVTAEVIYDKIKPICNPDFVDKAWQMFVGYKLFYSRELITPLAVEHDLKDPRTGESCRYDLIAFFPESIAGRPPGTYLIEHKCLVAGTKVFDPQRGRQLSIEEFSGDVVALDEYGALVAASALRPESNGVQEVFRLVTDHGRVLEGNARHPISTLKGWRGLGALTPDDWVAVPRRLAAPFAQGVHSDAAVRLIGYLLGDGSLGDTIRFAKGHAGVRREVISCAALCGWPVAERDGKERVDYVEFIGKRDEGAYRFIDDLGLRHLTAEHKHIPETPFSDSQVPLLIGALWDTDGCIDVFYENGFAKPRIAFVSRSEALASGALHLLDRLGLEASVRASSVEYRGERRPVWTTKIVGRRSKREFCRAVLDGLIHSVRLTDAAEEALNAIHDVDDEAVPTAWIRQRVDLDALDARFRLAVRSNRTMGLGRLRSWSPVLAQAYMAQQVRWERVETLLAVGRAEVFNLEVPGPHTFVANGIVTHNTTSRFDFDALDGWGNDGEVIGEVALWKRLGLDYRFGKLRGIIINLLGKQKEPQFHRTLVSPESWQIEAHLDDLRRWEGLIQLARSSDNFPRSRNGCIGRFGRCDYFDHCFTGEG
jgi:intein/homing endonuclease